MIKQLNGVAVNITVLSLERYLQLAPKKTESDYYDFVEKKKPKAKKVTKKAKAEVKKEEL